jgi:hypothetical protein
MRDGSYGPCATTDRADSRRQHAATISIASTFSVAAHGTWVPRDHAPRARLSIVMNARAV